MFSDKKFVDVKIAIGALVMSGFHVEWVTEKKSQYEVYGKIVINTIYGNTVLNTFRDGSSYVIKTESVQDMIDQKDQLTSEYADFQLV